MEGIHAQLNKRQRQLKAWLQYANGLHWRKVKPSQSIKEKAYKRIRELQNGIDSLQRNLVNV